MSLWHILEALISAYLLILRDAARAVISKEENNGIAWLYTELSESLTHSSLENLQSLSKCESKHVDQWRSCSSPWDLKTFLQRAVHWRTVCHRQGKTEDCWNCVWWMVRGKERGSAALCQKLAQMSQRTKEQEVVKARSAFPNVWNILIRFT